MNSIIYFLYVISILTGTVASIIFPINYTISVKWWRSEIGRHLFAYSLLFALLFIRGAVNLFNPVSKNSLMAQSTGNVIVIMSITVFAVLVSCQRVWIFHKTRKQEREGQRHGANS